MSLSGRRRHKPAGELDPERERRKGNPDRRNDDGSSEPKAEGNITFDEKGNAVWNWRVDTPRRREDDPTIDFLKCLDLDDLEIEGDDSEPDPTVNKFNPYSRG